MATTAILVVWVEDVSTLPMNEFYDYNGKCYGLTRSRLESGKQCIELEDFYDCTVRSEKISGVPIVFVTKQGDAYQSVGWYKEATVQRNIERPSLFLEGNILADSRMVVALSTTDWEKYVVECHFSGNRLYEVIETDDSRHEKLQQWIQNYSGKNACMRQDFVDKSMNPRDKRSHDLCIEHCEELAQRLMSDACENIAEIVRLEAYAQQACTLDSRSVNGWYYFAMAAHQLGHTKQGMKAIEKALRLEPDAADLMAMKGLLLTSMGYIESATELFHQAWQVEGDEDYLLLEGQAWLLKEQVDKALPCFKQISDTKKLEEKGIRLKDMERRWPFMNIRGFHFKNFFGKN